MFFFLVRDKSTPILGWPGLRQFKLSINCPRDCLVNLEGEKIICRAIRAKNMEGETRTPTAVDLYLKVIVTRPTKECKIKTKGSRLDLSGGAPVVLGPGEKKRVILPYRVKGSGLQFVVNICRVRSMMSSVVLCSSGELVVQMYNTSSESELIS